MADIVLWIRHLPCKVSKAELTEVLVQFGLDTCRYSVHVPKRRCSRGKTINFGYGFITCRHWSDAEALTRALQGFCFTNIQSGKRLSVELAHRSLIATDFSSALFKSQMTSDAGVLPYVSAPAGLDVLSASGNTKETACQNERSATFGALNEAHMNDVFGLPPTIPDACEVPPTRLATFL
eukprot:TRINITY_DN47102_c0_g1_i1.p1 TRINITY_DN47102_c0_g1~~TRINITY_DN47102_c0_g1_i1.p1  ORF type:complete len:194 (-),score=16.47 TRINITY_DN47102_c0_g1_i1:353-892(-)